MTNIKGENVKNTAGKSTKERGCGKGAEGKARLWDDGKEDTALKVTSMNYPAIHRFGGKGNALCKISTCLLTLRHLPPPCSALIHRHFWANIFERNDLLVFFFFTKYH